MQMQRTTIRESDNMICHALPVLLPFPLWSIVGMDQSLPV